MKEETQQSQGNTGCYRGGAFSSGEKGRWESKKASKHPLCQRKIEDGLQKGLAKL